MRWWSRRSRRPSPETIDARGKLEQARRSLAAARADDAAVDKVTERVDALRRRNHFGPMINRALRGSR
ncbi:hypothetical protein GA0070616_4351 [Micromonospora nigra]|uniref:Uncharacterized protein n=1 Tax=Micromonospora nigra TaxID=145857 RepID=A0A1C6SQV5_9ACTN|nr:hypothetical protein [Micromonospora nigra]SCL31888.1 hypothetical protein GA0070616_4351 [Micromonospora nigra]